MSMNVVGSHFLGKSKTTKGDVGSPSRVVCASCHQPIPWPHMHLVMLTMVKMLMSNLILQSTNLLKVGRVVRVGVDQHLKMLLMITTINNGNENFDICNRKHLVTVCPKQAG